MRYLTSWLSAIILSILPYLAFTLKENPSLDQTSAPARGNIPCAIWLFAAVRQYRFQSLREYLLVAVILMKHLALERKITTLPCSRAHVPHHEPPFALLGCKMVLEEEERTCNESFRGTSLSEPSATLTNQSSQLFFSSSDSAARCKVRFVRLSSFVGFGCETRHNQSLNSLAMRDQRPTSRPSVAW